MRTLDWSFIGTGREVSDSPRFVRCNADDSLMFDWHVVDTRHACLRVIDHGVAAEIIRARFVFLGIPLLRSDIDSAALADVVASMELCLSGEAASIDPDFFFRIDDHVHGFVGGIEFNEICVVPVFCSADIKSLIMSLHNGEIPTLFTCQLRRDAVCLRP